MVTFALYKGSGSLSDKTIQLTTLSRYSHIELMIAPIPQPSTLCISASKRDGYVVRRKHIRFNPERWDFLTVPHLHTGDLWTMASKKLGQPYNTLGAVCSLINVDAGKTDTWFCSELMAYISKLTRPCRFTPGSFARYHLRHSNAGIIEGVDLWQTTKMKCTS